MTLRSLLRLTAGLLLIPCLPSCTGLGQGGTGAHAIANIGPTYPGIASYIVADANDGRVLFSLQADQKRPVASLTKIATTVVVLDFIRGSSGSLDEVMTVPPSVATLGVPSPLGIQAGDGISVRDALYAAMMASDNFAAETLGTHFGAKLSQAGLGGAPLQAFVSQMNGLRSKLGLSNTKFANPHGLDLPNASGYSSASDMARLLNHAITTPGFTFYCSQKERRIAFLRNGAAQSLTVRNTNEIIGRNRIDAGKTGTTTLAGPCLAITAPKPATVIKRSDGSTLVIPHRITVVTLAAPDRFNASSRLLADGWSRYDGWRAAGSPAGSASEYLGAAPSATAAAAPAPASAPAPTPPPAPAPASFPVTPEPGYYPTTPAYPQSGGYQPMPY
ncbi:MAG: d-alanyl-d-alanine carboxypeptidase [Verrucomicrobiales bacterium]|nr:d-alanyl-d-alanine carboxypeptidase [Verrucomicrobiales bacterium]